MKQFIQGILKLFLESAKKLHRGFRKGIAQSIYRTKTFSMMFDNENRNVIKESLWTGKSQ